MNELRALCQPEDRTKNQAKNYESIQECAEKFNATAVRIVTLMQQPVPFVYFHILKLMMVLVNCLISFVVVLLFGEDWPLSFVTLGIAAAMLFGLQEIAVAMSDPFGTDDSDFDTHKLCSNSYRNAVAYLTAKRVPERKGSLVKNPIKVGLSP
jgi:predicted membrane chloride channel (bestrophin family)